MEWINLNSSLLPTSSLVLAAVPVLLNYKFIAFIFPHYYYTNYTLLSLPSTVKFVILDYLMLHTIACVCLCANGFN